MPDETPTVTVTDSVVLAISSQLPDVSDEQVSAVLETWNAVLQGDPLGTVRLDTASGQIGHRVSIDGVHMWRISAPDGGQWTDMQPTLPWTVVSTPDV